jgi:phosphoglycerate dehydrogenase-like enzyme
MKPFKVLILTADDPALYQQALQFQGVEITVRSPGDAIPEIDQIDAVVGGWFSRELLERAERLRYFLVPFAGIPRPLQDLLQSRRGLCIANSHYNADFVAEHVFAMIFHLCRNLQGMDRFMRRHRMFRRHCPTVNFIALKEKTMGILGAGHIGRAVEKRAQAFGMDCLLYRRDDYLRDGVEKRKLHHLLRRSDMIVVTLPLTEETQGLLGEEEFACMGADTVFINISRGEIVEEAALFNALQKKKIRAAGVDAWYNYVEGFFSPEKAYTQPFSRLSNLVMTPHVAYRADTLNKEKLASIRAFICDAAMGKAVSSRVDPVLGY